MPSGLKRFQQAEALHFIAFSCFHRLRLLEAPRGDLTSDSVSNTYTWDGEGMPASANGVDYYYDAEGNRVGKSGSSATDIIYFGGQAMARL